MGGGGAAPGDVSRAHAEPVTTPTSRPGGEREERKKAESLRFVSRRSSVGERDDGRTGAERNSSVSELLTIIKTCSLSLALRPPPLHSPFYSRHLRSRFLRPISPTFNLPRSAPPPPPSDLPAPALIPVSTLTFIPPTFAFASASFLRPGGTLDRSSITRGNNIQAEMHFLFFLSNGLTPRLFLLPAKIHLKHFQLFLPFCPKQPQSVFGNAHQLHRFLRHSD